MESVIKRKHIWIGLILTLVTAGFVVAAVVNSPWFWIGAVVVAAVYFVTCRKWYKCEKCGRTFPLVVMAGAVERRRETKKDTFYCTKCGNGIKIE